MVFSCVFLDAFIAMAMSPSSRGKYRSPFYYADASRVQAIIRCVNKTYAMLLGVFATDKYLSALYDTTFCVIRK